MFFTIIFILLCVPFVWWYMFMQKYKSLDVIPGPKPLPLVGNALDIGSNPQAFFINALKMFKQYGEIFKIYIGNEVKVFIANADMLEQIMSSNVHITKSDGYVLFYPLVGLGLLTSTGKKWKSRRKMITPTFHFKILDQFLEVFNESANILVEKLSQEVGKQSFDLYPYINLFSLDVVCETAMGVKISSQEGQNEEYVVTLRDFLDIVMTRFFSFWKKFDFLYKFSVKECYLHNKQVEILQKFSSDVIKKRREEKVKEKMKLTPSDDGIRRKVALLDMLLESETSHSLTNDDIKEEINTFMFEGHDTTTSGICFSLLSLANYPDIQKRAYEEIIRVVGEDSYVTIQNLQEMKYLEMVIKEVLRMYASVPLIERRLEEDCNIGGIDFPKDTTLSLYLHGVHQNEKYFPEPERFDPERFLLQNLSERHNYAFVPFSAGPRNCIGQKYAMLDIKVIIVKILQKYQILTVPNFKPELGNGSVLKSYNGIWLQIQDRSTSTTL